MVDGIPDSQFRLCLRHRGTSSQSCRLQSSQVTYAANILTLDSTVVLMDVESCHTFTALKFLS